MISYSLTFNFRISEQLSCRCDQWFASSVAYCLMSYPVLSNYFGWMAVKQFSFPSQPSPSLLVFDCTIGVKHFVECLTPSANFTHLLPLHANCFSDILQRSQKLLITVLVMLGCTMKSLHFFILFFLLVEMSRECSKWWWMCQRSTDQD